MHKILLYVDFYLILVYNISIETILSSMDKENHMYTNYAYLRKLEEDIVATDKPLLVTAAGNLRIHTKTVTETYRSNGRGDYQLLYVAAGKVQFYFDQKVRFVSKGNMVHFRPGEPQIYNLYAKDNPETYWVHFTGSDVDRLLDTYQMPRNENVFFAGIFPDYQWLFRQMIYELRLKRVNFEELLTMNLTHIFLLINRYIREGRTPGADMLDVVERSIHYFNENYSQPISIEQYAAEHNFTPSWFIQSFRNVTKMTPLQYIVSLRITNAMNLLGNTNYSISRIAAAVGYENALYFSRLFKKHTGLSPSEYRNRDLSLQR